MKFIDSKQLDLRKWDQLVTSSPVNNVFCYSWYLSATCQKWGAIVSENYDFGLPLPYKNRIFYKQVFQHPFSRNLEFFGDPSRLGEAIQILSGLGKFRFSFNHPLTFPFNLRKFQYLSLNEEIVYKKNTIRILNRNADQYHFKVSREINAVRDFYFQNSFYKIKQQKKNKKFLSQLLESAVLNKKGEAIEVFDRDNKLCGAAFYLLDKETVVYLIGDCDPEHKKNGLMFSLMDFAIKTYQKKYRSFDFGGSNIESVATFYKKLGGQDQEYFEYYQ